MNREYARRMSALTSDFYQCVASSFDATRQSLWTGWDRVLAETGIGASTSVDIDGRPLRVLDVACGNLRFERFLQERGVRTEVWAWDNCDELVAAGDVDAHFEKLDVAEALLGYTGLREVFDGDAQPLPTIPPCDLAVSFGFMHHLPLFDQRVALLRALVGRTLSGGHVCVTFWQFADDPRLSAKARPVEDGGEHDYLLGWQDLPDVWRFCHHATDEEIDALVASVSDVAGEKARFSADGRSGQLNRYLVLHAR